MLLNGQPEPFDGIHFALNRRLDAHALRATFAHNKRVQIGDFLESDCAAALADLLRRRSDWVRVMNSDARVFELDRVTVASLSAEQRERLDDAVFAGARSGFQYRYETIRVPDNPEARRRSGDPLGAFAEFLSGGAVRDLLRFVIDAPSINLADAQATAYAPGDFLTAHDDDVGGKHRQAAYVLSLSPIWRAEWGGLLLFHDAAGDVERGYTPRFNTLNLFAVPQLHSVSLVSRAAAHRRYAVTGWLRSA